MPLNVLFAAQAARWTEYQAPLEQALADAGLDAHLSLDISPSEVDYIVYAPNGDLQDFAPYSQAKAVLSLWAGVEKIVGNQSLRIPLTRMVDPGLTKGMVEWVTGHVMRYHLGMDQDIKNSSAQWSPRTVPLAEERDVVVLGLGALGQEVARTLKMLGFNVSGWSRNPKSLEGIRCLFGPDGLKSVLQHAQILITLLPDTPATENTLNSETLAAMPFGAYVINPGRGPLIDDDALLSALASGQIAHATLDVFRTEPLPKGHAYWSHPKVTVTPHIAAETRPITASRVIAENIRRFESGEPLLHLVDRTSGY